MSLVQRVFLEVAYDGAPYCGWQMQSDEISVQSELERALALLCRQPIPVTGAGRTDAGVHAYRMMAHADLPIPHLPLEQIQRGLCGILRGGISVRSITPVHPKAHARFDAMARKYHYYISACSNPFWGDYCWERRNLPNISLMNEACKQLIGLHDFTSFSKLHTQTKHNRCTVYEAHWEKVEMPGLWDAIRCEVCANRFLHGMVRTMVGTLLEVGYGQRKPDSIVDLINSQDRSLAGSAAPARALFFVEATYPDWIYDLQTDNLTEESGNSAVMIGE